MTPFIENCVDFPQMRLLAREQHRRGSDQVLVNGTTAERPCLMRRGDIVEDIEIARVVCEEIGSHNVVVNVGSNCTEESVEMAQEIAKLQPGGMMAVSPYYNKPTSLGMYLHFKAIAQAIAPIPLILYDVPGRTGVKIPASIVVRLVKEVSNIVGFKAASSDMRQIAAIIQGTPDDFQVLSGNDGETLKIMRLGGIGVISVASNIPGVTELVSEMVEAEFAGDHEKADELNERLTPLFKALFCVSNPIPGKYAMKKIGFPIGDPRRPLTTLEEEDAFEGTSYCKVVRKALAGLDVSRY